MSSIGFARFAQFASQKFSKPARHVGIRRALESPELLDANCADWNADAIEGASGSSSWGRQSERNFGRCLSHEAGDGLIQTARTSRPLFKNFHSVLSPRNVAFEPRGSVAVVTDEAGR